MMETLARLKEKFSDLELLRGHLAGYLPEHGLSQERAAKEAGISPAACNRFIQGKYAGDNEAIAEKILIWLASRERRAGVVQSLGNHDFTATDTSERILQLLQFAQVAGDLSVIYGGAGVGKTTSIRHYARLNCNVWIVVMRPDTSGVAAALEEIGEVMGVRSSGRANRLSRDICRRLEDTHGLLIIDEAQHLSVPAIEAIRSIHDATGIGLVLSGNESVYARLTGGARAASFAQLFSRIGKRLRLTKTTRQDVDSIAALYGISGEKELSTLHGISQKPGALRGVVKTIRLACMYAAGRGEAVTLDHIDAAWRSLGGEG
jgi:DNA transposition AAA+ family ATPase